MGFEQYAYAAYKRGERRKYWDGISFNKKTGLREFNHPEPHEISYWRKHRQLQSWMDDLWIEKGKPFENPDADPVWGSTFNGVELELTWNDIQRLEDYIKDPDNIWDSSYKEEDLQFCLDAKEQLFLYRKRVFYYPSW